MDNQYDPPLANVEDGNRSNTTGITSSMIDAMRGTKPWVLLIAIVLIISSVFMLLGTLGIIIASVIDIAMAGSDMAAFMFVGLMYAGMGFVYILLAVLLFKYNSAIGRLLQTSSATDMEDALHAQRKFWKIVGITTAVMIVLMILGFIAAMVISISTMHF